MRLALRLAERGLGTTSPNPLVGAVLVKNNKIIGQGWHRRAGEPHAEIEAIRAAQARKERPQGSTLYVTLEPCCTHGRTPPCTEAIQDAGIKRLVVGAIDPNPAHAGKGIDLLRRAGLQINLGVLAAKATRMNEAFNHLIVHRTPFVTVKAAMTLDGKIATATGESKWITSEKARAYGMKLRQAADAILVGVNTILVDDPRLSWRNPKGRVRDQRSEVSKPEPLLRIVLDSRARTPLDAQVASDQFAAFTTVVVTKAAPRKRVLALSKRVRIWVAPAREGWIDLRWLLKKLGQEDVTSLLVEGGGEVNASFLLEGLSHRIVFFYAPKIIGGRDAIKAVSGQGVDDLRHALGLREVEWRRLGQDLLLTARCNNKEHNQ